MKKKDRVVISVQKWFHESVTYKKEPFALDYEQAAAVVDNSKNTIVIARAGSGKTRTLVAKVVYLVAKCNVLPETIMVFVFNANAAREINERLAKIRVDGKTIIGDIGIASTFHAFSRKIVYENCKKELKDKKILAEEKEAYVLGILNKMVNEDEWKQRIMLFVEEECGMSWQNTSEKMNDERIRKLAGMMTQFVNRAQQKYLGGDLTVGEAAKSYLEKISVNMDGRDDNERSRKEEIFIELGVEVFRRYHWYLLGFKHGLDGFNEYGTDFNLIVSWASKLILGGRSEVVMSLKEKKYILVDEYQDFSQLFLAAVMAIRSVASGARLFVVGDDWQAINRFAGSEVEYFKRFDKYFGSNCKEFLISGDDRMNSCTKYEISTNYRCDRMIVDVARRFMVRAMKEKGKFKAFSRKNGKVVVVNPREVEVGYALVPYDLRISVEDRILREAAERMGCVVVKRSMVQYLKTVVKIVKKNIGLSDVLILHRNNETNIGGVSLAGFGNGLRWGLDRLGILPEEKFDGFIHLMTMHKSKGLEADVVIILEANEGVIPKLHPDTLLYGMFGETLDVALNDQKRLFYVAMTRAKHRLYILSEGGGFMKYLGKGVERWGE